jgi:hypothetical protein
MGTAEYLAGAAVLIIIAVIALLYFSAKCPTGAIREEPHLSGGRQTAPGVSSVPSATSVTPTKAAAGNWTPPRGYHQPRWQYKYKDVPRYNSDLARMELVRELMLVYE